MQKEKSMSYEIRNEIPCVEDYIEIRLKAGLSRKSVEAASIGLKNSIFGVVVYFNDIPIGINRFSGLHPSRTGCPNR